MMPYLIGIKMEEAGNARCSFVAWRMIWKWVFAIYEDPTGGVTGFRDCIHKHHEPWLSENRD
jgi:hypothetical protein